MKNQEIFNDLSKIQASVLALVAWSDGEISTEEKEFFSEIVEISPCSESLKKELSKYLTEPPILEDILNLLNTITPEIVIPVIKNAYLIASADGVIKDEEKSIIKQVANKIGVSQENEEVFWQWLDLYHKCDLIEEKLFQK